MLEDSPYLMAASQIEVVRAKMLEDSPYLPHGLCTHLRDPEGEGEEDLMDPQPEVNWAIALEDCACFAVHVCCVSWRGREESGERREGGGGRRGREQRRAEQSR